MPQIEDLPGELSRVAAAIEEHMPGDGVRITLQLAQIFHGQEVYFRRVDGILRALRDDAMRARYDKGGITTKGIALLFGVSQSTAEKVLSKPDSQAALQAKQGKLWEEL